MLNRLVHAALLAGLLSVTSSLHGQTVVASLSAIPESYSGQCPAEIQFFGFIVSSQAGYVQFYWFGSDGSRSPLQTLEFDRPGLKSIESTSVTVSVSSEGWQAIKVVSPKTVESNSAFFRVQCQRPTASDRFRFVVFGDSQDEGGPTQYGVNGDIFEPLLAVVDQYRPDFVVFVGDMAINAELHHWWEWHRFMKRLAVPIYNVVGNHDVGNPYPEVPLLFNPESWIEYQQAYQSSFSHLPANGPPGYEHLAYSFEYGNSLFVILDSFYISLQTGTAYWSKVSYEQRDWFQETVARAHKVHRFAFAHAPAKYVVNPQLDDDFFSLWLVVNDFDTLFTGHEHLYARWALGSQPTPVQIISGGAGGELTEKDEVNQERSPDFVSSTHHFVVVDVAGNDVTIQAIDSTGERLDKFVLSRK